jgi:hypothetical protein
MDEDVVLFDVHRGEHVVCEGQDAAEDEAVRRVVEDVEPAC